MGTVTTVVHFGHFAFLPAAVSGTRNCWLQLGQRNSIGIGESFEHCSGLGWGGRGSSRAGFSRLSSLRVNLRQLQWLRGDGDYK
jgi:hypothetical protein